MLTYQTNSSQRPVTLAGAKPDFVYYLRSDNAERVTSPREQGREEVSLMEADLATQEQDAPQSETPQQEAEPQGQEEQKPAEETPEASPAEEKKEGQEYPPEIIKATERAQALLNSGPNKTKYTIGYDRVEEYMKIVKGTENFLSGMTIASMRRMANGETRVPRELTEKYKGTYQHLRPHWHWLKGIIAVAVAMNYHPPKVQEPEPVEEPEQADKVSEAEADTIAAEKVETDESGKEAITS
jgi:hypothetical protein